MKPLLKEEKIQILDALSEYGKVSKDENLIKGGLE